MRERAFTLIELLIALAVATILISGFIIAINPGKRIRQANDTKIKNDIGQIGLALKSYLTDNSYYPQFLSDLVSSGNLKVLPNSPTGSPYSYERTSGCSATPYSNCEAVVYDPLQDPTTPGSGDVWCFRSAIGQAQELAAASCTP